MKTDMKVKTKKKRVKKKGGGDKKSVNQKKLNDITKKE